MRALIFSSALFALGASAFAAAPLPRPAQQLEIVDGSGKHLLSSYKGKVVVVQFLFTTCPHCQAFSGVLTKAAERTWSQGIPGVGRRGGRSHASEGQGLRLQVCFELPGWVPLSEELVFPFMSMSIMERIRASPRSR